MYNWKRFWCSREGKINLEDDGFLFNPDSEYSIYHPSNVVPFNEINKLSCLVLLGSPGIGKTTTLEEEFDNHQKQNTGKDKYLTFNLNEYGNELRLLNEIFKSSEFTDWLNGDYLLHLFIDSFDECLLEIPKLSTIIKNQLTSLNGKADRLKLWVACRSGEWPEYLTDEFYKIWEEKNVGVFELAPLRKKDVKEAAESNNIDSTKFINDIIDREIQPLAINPITLEFLLQEYKTNQQFPDSKYELFNRGCLQLCKENNPDRFAAHGKKLLSQTKRLALASRIAAVMIFCNKSTVSLTITNGKNGDHIIDIFELQEGIEIDKGYEFAFTEKNLVETIKQTTLFSSRGPDMFGFSHWSYAEFLAAFYLNSHQLSFEKIKSLVFTHDDIDLMVVPQLKETTAWISTQFPEILLHVIINDPKALLAGDVQNLSDKQRYELVASLLNKFEENKIQDTNIYRLYKKLDHPKLVSQLKPYIENKTKSYLVRQVAIDIAEVCGKSELQKLLVEISLDKSEDVYIRYQAAYAISKIGNVESKKRLKIILNDPIPEDKDDELKGAVLLSLWPGIITTKELFSFITEAKSDSLFGWYYSFLHDVPKKIEINELPIALNWVISISNPDIRFDSHFNSIADEILYKGYTNLENSDVLEVYSLVAIKRIENNLDVFPKPSSLKDGNEIPEIPGELRRNLIVSIVNNIDDYPSHFLMIYSEQQRLLLDHDMKWLIEKLFNEKDDKKRNIWCQLVSEVFSMHNHLHTELVFYAMDKNQILKEKFESIFAPIKINSKYAQSFRKTLQKRQKWDRKINLENKRRNRELAEFDIITLIQNSLKKIEDGKLEYFWCLVCKQISLTIDNGRIVNENTVDITNTFGWKSIDEQTKDRIITAAKNYLLKAKGNSEEWIAKDILYLPDIAAYKAFVLIHLYEPDYIDNLPRNIWREWGPIIIGYPEYYVHIEDNNVHSYLIKKAYRYASKQVVSTLFAIINYENSKNKPLSNIKKITGILDIRLKNNLLNKIHESELENASFGTLLTLLIKSNHLRSIRYAKSLVKHYDSNDKEKVKIAATALLLHGKKSFWLILKRLMNKDTVFAKKVFLNFSSSLRFNEETTIPRKIGEKETANLFIWLLKHFPSEKDPNKEGVKFGYSARESIADFRDSLLRILIHWGSVESVNAIKIIIKKYPEIDYFKHNLTTARESMRRKDWIPLSPNDFLSFVKKTSSRIIKNSHDLLTVVIECLERIESKLQGKPPIAGLLWDTRSFWPKQETDLSDYIKSELKDELEKSGIIALREVEIRPPKKSEGSKPGEKIDIYLATFIETINQYISVFIEIKGCWNSDVKTAMENQLMKRYLNQTDCNYGIYLVGWYLCDQWDNNDKRKRKTFTSDIENAKAFLNKQAAELSVDKKTVIPYVLNCTLQ